MKDGIEIFYDGECPFCSAWVRMLNLRDAVGRVDLIDARGDDPRIAALGAVDLNAGMVVHHGGRLWHGAEAMHLLSILSERGGPLRALMRNPRRAALIYPALRTGRGLVLRLMGRRPIG